MIAVALFFFIATVRIVACVMAAKATGEADRLHVDLDEQRFDLGVLRRQNRAMRAVLADHGVTAVDLDADLAELAALQTVADITGSAA